MSKSNDNPMSLAKSRMLVKHVFFAVLLLETKMIPWTDAECERMAAANGGQATAPTDMVSIWYSPTVDTALSNGGVLLVLAHEIMHKALKHGLRTGGRNPELANIAMDFAINIILKNAGFTIWEHAY